MCAAAIFAFIFAGCASKGDEYNARDLSDAAQKTLDYEGSFTLRKTESEVFSFFDDEVEEEDGAYHELSRTYDAEGGASVRISKDETSGFTSERDADGGYSEDETMSFKEERLYFVPEFSGSPVGTQFMYSYSDDMDEEAVMSVSEALAGAELLSEDLDFFGIRFKEFTFREMYTGYLEDILINYLDVDEDNIVTDISVETSGKKSAAVTSYAFTAEGGYSGDYSGFAEVSLGFTIEGGYLTEVNFNLSRNRMTATDELPFTETLEYAALYEIAYEYDESLMLTEREQREYYSG